MLILAPLFSAQTPFVNFLVSDFPLSLIKLIKVI